MQSDNQKPAASVAVAIVAAMLMTTTAVVTLAATVELRLGATKLANSAITPETEDILSSAAIKAVRHIAEARSERAC